MNKKYILALDLGTTGNRAIVFDKNQNIISSEYEEFTQYFPKPGWVEHDAEEIWKSTQRILSRTFKKVNFSQIAAIGITNQRETVVLWDKKTGKPVHRAIVWQCRRTADYCQTLKEKGYEKLVHQKTGLVLDAYFTASKINWMIKNVKGVGRRVEQGKILAGTIDSWIVYKLTGAKQHITDTSNASRTLLMDIRTLRWDDKLCSIFQVPKNILPKIVPSSFVGVMLDKKLFGCEIPICALVGDQQSAAFAQGCYESGVIKNTYGTGLFMLENIGRKPKYSKNLLTTVAWSLGHLKNTEYAFEGSVFIGGAAIQWLRDGLKLFDKSSDTEKMATEIKDNEGVYFVPALVGLGSPYWDPNARGLIIGITRGTKRAHFVRAALESIAFGTRDVLQVIKKDSKKNFKILRVDGGATANNFLMQFQADILGIPVERPVIQETTALGAAALAGIAVGFWKNRQDFSRQRRVNRVFKPNPSFKNREEMYRRWKEATQRALHWEKPA